MSRNIICVPFALEDNMKSGVNISNVENIFEIYIKNACVALMTAKYYNPDCDVLLATNIEEKTFPFDIVQKFKKYDVRILTIPFDFFRFPATYKWGLAFYKLCVLRYLCECDYDNICYLDTDVYVQGNFEAIWKECEQHILLYDVNHGLNVCDYVDLLDEVEFFLGERKLLTHYGGEFLACSIENAKKFCSTCENIYNRMCKEMFVTNKGDEFIIALAADENVELIKNASPYIFRFWTGMNFRLISTVYKNNRILVLHVPDEKERGMITLYNKYISKCKIPKENIVWKKLSLEKSLFFLWVKGKLSSVRCMVKRKKI